MAPYPAQPFPTQQALLYQVALALNLSATLLTLVALGMLLAAPSGNNAFYVALMSLLTLLLWVGLLATRRNHAAQTALLVGLPMLASTLIGVLIANGAAVSSFSYAIPLVLGALLMRPRQALALFGLCALLSIGLFGLEFNGYTGPIDTSAGLQLGGELATLLTLALVAFSSVRGQQTLRAAQAVAEQRAHELEEAQRELEWRHWQLEAVQEALVSGNKALQHKLVSVSELGVNGVFLAPGMLIVPLEGEIGIDLAHLARARLLAACTMQEAHTLVLDLRHAVCRPRAARLLAQSLESVMALGIQVILCAAGDQLGALHPGIRRFASLQALFAEHQL